MEGRRGGSVGQSVVNGCGWEGREGGVGRGGEDVAVGAGQCRLEATTAAALLC